MTQAICLRQMIRVMVFGKVIMFIDAHKTNFEISNVLLSVMRMYATIAKSIFHQVFMRVRRVYGYKL